MRRTEKVAAAADGDPAARPSVGALENLEQVASVVATLQVAVEALSSSMVAEGAG